MLRKMRTYMYQRPRLEETRDRDREPFQSGVGLPAGVPPLSIERKIARLTDRDAKCSGSFRMPFRIREVSFRK